MNQSHHQTIQALCDPMLPIATGVAPRLTRLDDIRAVLFDVYGTMLISGSGDVGTSAKLQHAEAWTDAARAVGVAGNVEPDAVMARLQDTIRAEHLTARARGIEYPEVDIVEVWQRTLTGLAPQVGDDVIPAWERTDWESLALNYELRVNPVWPMPDLLTTLEFLRARKTILGIVSNAQFFTPLILETLLDRSLDKLGFRPELTYFSFEDRQAKPGRQPYETVQERLEGQGVSAEQTLYVGNDMLNDITAAASVGFRTALFAGDRRSLRWREGDERVTNVKPDVVITELPQLTSCLV